MSKISYIRTLAIFMSVLIISLPLILADELSLTTNKNGALVTGDGYYREYNALGQLIRIRDGNTQNGEILEEFTWSPIEDKIFIRDVYKNGVLNYSIYYVDESYIATQNSSGLFSEKYIYQDGQLIGMVDTDGNKFSVHGDHLGSVSLIADVDGNTVEETFYSPFGEILEGGQVSRFTYTGKEFDTINNEYDFLARRYKADWGIFIEVDDSIPEIYNPQSLNSYSYTINNPYVYVDPDGNIYYKDLFFATADTVQGVSAAGLGFTVATGGAPTVVAVPAGTALVIYGSGTAQVGFKNIVHAIKEEYPEKSFAVQVGELAFEEEGELIGGAVDTTIGFVSLKGSQRNLRRASSGFDISKHLADFTTGLTSTFRSAESFLNNVANNFFSTNNQKQLEEERRKNEIGRGGGGGGCRNCFVTTRDRLNDIKKRERNKRALRLFAKIRSKR